MALLRKERTRLGFELEGRRVRRRVQITGDGAEAGRKLRGVARHQKHLLGSEHGILCPELLEE